MSETAWLYVIGGIVGIMGLLILFLTAYLARLERERWEKLSEREKDEEWKDQQW